MLRIRLRRVGAKKQPSYRITVAESTTPRDGKFVEVIGFYNPRTEPETVTIKEDRALYWLSVGAQPSDAVMRIFKTHGTAARFERLRAGESLEALVAEAEAGAEAEEEEAAAVEAEEAEVAPEAELEEAAAETEDAETEEAAPVETEEGADVEVEEDAGDDSESLEVADVVEEPEATEAEGEGDEAEEA